MKKKINGLTCLCPIILEVWTSFVDLFQIKHPLKHHRMQDFIVSQLIKQTDNNSVTHFWRSYLCCLFDLSVRRLCTLLCISCVARIWKQFRVLLWILDWKLGVRQTIDSQIYCDCLFMIFFNAWISFLTLLLIFFNSFSNCQYTY